MSQKGQSHFSGCTGHVCIENHEEMVLKIPMIFNVDGYNDCSVVCHYGISVLNVWSKDKAVNRLKGNEPVVSSISSTKKPFCFYCSLCNIMPQCAHCSELFQLPLNLPWTSLEKGITIHYGRLIILSRLWRWFDPYPSILCCCITSRIKEPVMLLCIHKLKPSILQEQIYVHASLGMQCSDSDFEMYKGLKKQGKK